uniref:Uncharacterized protein n=1 Tax=Arundo donax TaxID=35708 RepID=A0A0A9F285_ARUDO
MLQMNIQRVLHISIMLRFHLAQNHVHSSFPPHVHSRSVRILQFLFR